MGTVKKSKATITSRWLARKASHCLAGSPRRRCRYLATGALGDLEAELKKFPWIFGAPQSEFSAAMRRMRVRTSSLSLGRPPRGRDRQRQYRRKPDRCQPTTVSGFTMTRTSDHRGHMCRRAVQKKRSRRFSKGRGRFRLSTATCCRKARTSSEVSTRLRKNTRMAARNAVIKWSTNQPL